MPDVVPTESPATMLPEAVQATAKFFKEIPPGGAFVPETQLEVGEKTKANEVLGKFLLSLNRAVDTSKWDNAGWLAACKPDFFGGQDEFPVSFAVRGTEYSGTVFMYGVDTLDHPKRETYGGIGLPTAEMYKNLYPVAWVDFNVGNDHKSPNLTLTLAADTNQTPFNENSVGQGKDKIHFVYQKPQK